MNFVQRISALLFVLLFSSGILLQLHANPVLDMETLAGGSSFELPLTPEMAEMAAEAPDVLKIKIKIIIIIKKKGIAEITGFQLDNGEKVLGKNQILAEAEIRGKKLVVKLLKAGFERGRVQTLAISRPLKVNANVSRKLGYKGTMVLKVGKITAIKDLEAQDKLGNFEIQD